MCRVVLLVESMNDNEQHECLCARAHGCFASYSSGRFDSVADNEQHCYKLLHWWRSCGRASMPVSGLFFLGVRAWAQYVSNTGNLKLAFIEFSCKLLLCFATGISCELVLGPCASTCSWTCFWGPFDLIWAPAVGFEPPPARTGASALDRSASPS